MVKTVGVFLAAAALLGIAGCKSSTGPDEADLIGTWNATKAEFVSLANPSTKVDIIPGGSTLTLVLSSSAFTLTITDPGQAPEVFTGTWTKSIDTLTLSWAAPMTGEAQFDFTLNADDLTMEGGHMPFEFTAGNAEEAILNLKLERQ